ncbi:uncharacterized protein LOC119791603 [Cyprinodon tularosa]|uniref:uncharacterized protein LOC119791603 n=1 Tax=Cyprinodon tularosa TaxID=77115 RepID=UPI0018E1F8C1|nr:uncharacterized protein LOC119791603 [Cyprinodon tularosa]
MMLRLFILVLSLALTQGKDSCCPHDPAICKRDVYLCYNSTRVISLVTIPFQTFSQSFKHDPGNWRGYDFYLFPRVVQITHNGWGDIFRTTGQWKKGSYGWTPLAKKWMSRISGFTVNHASKVFTMTINSTAEPLEKEGCSSSFLCARSSGTDPCWPLYLCPANITQEGDEIQGILTSAQGEQIKIQNINGPLKTDELFQVTTGISGQTNIWLLMAEQAAKTVSNDCLVCMGARPLLRVVPATITPQCLLNIMNYTVPSDNCTYWDKIYPLTTAEKKNKNKKTIFLKKVAVANFTCVNRTGVGPKLGTLNETQCASILLVSIFF